MTLTPDIGQAQRFIDALTQRDESLLTWQWFPDAKGQGREPPGYAHGPLSQRRVRLTKVNKAGSGVYLMVARGDGKGRSAKNALRPRAWFVDLDGADPDPVRTCALPPHIEVESSPKRFHFYWLVDASDMSAFTAIQKALAAKFGGDPAVHDWPRVMRVPGFCHMKNPKTPFMTRLVRVDEDAIPVTADELCEALGLTETLLPQAKSKVTHAEGPILKGARNNFLKTIAARERRGGLTGQALFDAIQHENLARCVPPKDEDRIWKLVENFNPKEGGVPVREDIEAPPDVDRLRAEIEAIPSEIDRLGLAQRLDPVCRMLQRVSPALAEAVLTEIIRPRWKLTREEVAAYRKTIFPRSAKGKKGAEEDNEKVFSALFPELVEIVRDVEDKPAFLVIVDGKPQVVSEWTDGEGRTLVPPPPEAIPFLDALPTGAAVLEAFAQESTLDPAKANLALIDDLEAFFREVSELPDDRLYRFLSWWTLHTHFAQQAEYSPILAFYAVPEMGKSRTGKALTYLSRRGILTETLRESYLFRHANNFAGTICFDVRDITRKLERLGSEDLLLTRFESGSKVPRVIKPDAGPFNDTVFFDNFGPTVILTNAPIDHILATRAVEIGMRPTAKTFDMDVTPDECLELKTGILALVMRQWGTPLQQSDKPIKGRLGDIMRIIARIVKTFDPDNYAMFEGLLHDLKKQRASSMSETREALVLRAVMDIKSEAIGRRLAITAVTDKANTFLNGDAVRMNVNVVSRRIGSFGFTKEIINKISYMILDDEICRLMCERYLPEYATPFEGEAAA